ncbi:lysophospholipid acyltransferase family protein [Vineibacter terrae]|uniref:lysophospholipid acyltransferase family protein n=1 Tax=Vineibacter terrae TaxID=2586908 RepID=UPI002E36D84D|nr:lysophospholipid acyltransferase family protein [Vineibacter terrae]HEX2892189.1 lysophospholipid acyltransferase family protein [Vineibacter terrae]
MIERLAARVITVFARLVTGVRTNWLGCQPEPVQRIYFANHSSHGDFVLIWTSLPPGLRAITRPVAGADYWQQSALRRFIGQRVFRAVAIPRGGDARQAQDLMCAALDGGASLIVFPEGTRNTGDEILLPFRSGLYWLAQARPDIECVPVWIANISRVLPKGEILPIPLLCTLTFGTPLKVAQDEDKTAFIARARSALLALASPQGNGESEP